MVLENELHLIYEITPLCGTTDRFSQELHEFVAISVPSSSERSKLKINILKLKETIKKNMADLSNLNSANKTVNSNLTNIETNPNNNIVDAVKQLETTLQNDRAKLKQLEIRSQHGDNLEEIFRSVGLEIDLELMHQQIFGNDFPTPKQITYELNCKLNLKTNRKTTMGAPERFWRMFKAILLYRLVQEVRFEIIDFCEIFNLNFVFFVEI